MRLALLLITLLIVVSVPADAGAATLRQQNTALRAEVARLKKLSALRLTASRTLAARVTKTAGERDAAISARDALQAALTMAQAALTTTQADLATRTTQRDNALAGLPAAISAVPIADFPRLVFDPARSAWPCDSFYTGTSGYWSYDFTNPSPYC
jgi:hypothetical protein